MNQTTPPRAEHVACHGHDLLRRVDELIREGNVRRISIKSHDGRVVAEFPLTIGVVGAALAPMFAAIGALAALLTECTISVERREP